MRQCYQLRSTHGFIPIINDFDQFFLVIFENDFFDRDFSVMIFFLFMNTERNKLHRIPAIVLEIMVEFGIDGTILPRFGRIIN